jgi:hypothetical protein
MGLNSCFFFSLKNHNVIKLFYAFLFLAFLTKRQNKKFSSSGKKFCFYSFYFFVDCSHFPPRSTVDFKPNFFFNFFNKSIFLHVFRERQNFSFIFITKVSARFFYFLSFYEFCLVIYTFTRVNLIFRNKQHNYKIPLKGTLVLKR